MRGNSSYRSGPGTSGYDVERPAQTGLYAWRKALRLQERERRSSPANIRNTFQMKLPLRCPS
jgi:hypothetical protein